MTEHGDAELTELLCNRPGWGAAMYDEANVQQLVRRAWDEARPIDMGHLGEHNRVLVCKAIVDLIEASLPA